MVLRVLLASLLIHITFAGPPASGLEVSQTLHYSTIEGFGDYTAAHSSPSAWNPNFPFRAAAQISHIDFEFSSTDPDFAAGVGPTGGESGVSVRVSHELSSVVAGNQTLVLDPTVVPSYAILANMLIDGELDVELDGNENFAAMGFSQPLAFEDPSTLELTVEGPAGSVSQTVLFGIIPGEDEAAAGRMRFTLSGWSAPFPFTEASQINTITFDFATTDSDFNGGVGPNGGESFVAIQVVEELSSVTSDNPDFTVEVTSDSTRFLAEMIADGAVKVDLAAFESFLTFTQPMPLDEASSLILTVHGVPEPSTALLLATGCIGGLPMIGRAVKRGRRNARLASDSLDYLKGRFIRAYILTACLFASVLPSSASCANLIGSYKFTNIIDNNGPFTSFSGVRSMNASGTVAFVASHEDGSQSILTGNGGPLTTILHADAESGIFFAFESPSINSSGTIAVRALLDDVPLDQAIYAGNGGPITTIADGSGPVRDVFSPSINAAGTVAFVAHFDNFLDGIRNSAILTGSGGPLSTVADANGPFFIFDPFEPAINAAGSVAFTAALDDMTPSAIDNPRGVFVVSGGTTTTIADSSGPFNNFFFTAINDSGTVAFYADLDAGGNGIFASMGGLISTVVDNSGPFQGFGGFSINASGAVAFSATLDGDFSGTGIFAGDDPVADKVIRVGDPLFGSIVSNVIPQFIATQSLAFNDNGEIAFTYQLANGVFGIAVASPIPEPTTEVLFLMGLAAAAVSRRPPLLAGLRRISVSIDCVGCGSMKQD